MRVARTARVPGCQGNAQGTFPGRLGTGFPQKMRPTKEASGRTSCLRLFPAWLRLAPAQGMKEARRSSGYRSLRPSTHRRLREVAVELQPLRLQLDARALLLLHAAGESGIQTLADFDHRATGRLDIHFGTASAIGSSNEAPSARDDSCANMRRSAPSVQILAHGPHDCIKQFPPGITAQAPVIAAIATLARALTPAASPQLRLSASWSNRGPSGHRGQQLWPERPVAGVSR